MGTNYIGWQYSVIVDSCSLCICSYYIFILFLIVKYVHYLLSVKFHCSCIPNPCYVTFRYVRYLLSFIVDNVIEYVFLVSDCCNVSILMVYYGMVQFTLISFLYFRMRHLLSVKFQCEQEYAPVFQVHGMPLLIVT